MSKNDALSRVIQLPAFFSSRLQSGVLASICDRLLRLKPDANPVIQIAVLQVATALLGIVDGKANSEIKDVYRHFFDMFTVRLFPGVYADLIFLFFCQDF